MGKKLARTAFDCGIAGLPLWLLSYAWLPFVLMGSEARFIAYAVVVGEVGALAAGALAVGLGIAARRRSDLSHTEYRLASRGFAMGALVLALVLVPNLLGSFLTR